MESESTTAGAFIRFHLPALIVLCLMLLLSGCGQSGYHGEPPKTGDGTPAAAQTPAQTETETAAQTATQTETQTAAPATAQTEGQTEAATTAETVLPKTLPGFTLLQTEKPDLVPVWVRRFLDASPEKRNIHDYRTTDDVPRPVILRFEADGLSEPLFEIQVSENPDFSEALLYETGETALAIANLKTDCDYYWTVTAKADGETYTAGIGSFHTLPGPRFLQIDGEKTGNFRDVGGYPTSFGVPVKQGVAFRGTELNGQHTVSDNGRFVLTQMLGVKTDLDLRGSDEGGNLTASPLGEDVKYLRISANSYLAFLTSANTAKIFAELAKPDNYPLYFHCVWGADRTGSLCAVLLALLGVDEEDILTDYELTTFSGSYERNRRSQEFSEFWQGLNAYEGQTLRERAEAFLLTACGMSRQQISNIRSIFLYGGATFGESSLTPRCASARPGRDVYLSLENFSTVTAADIGGITAEFQPDGEGVWITFPASLSPGETVGHLTADGMELTFSAFVRGT